MMYPNLQELNSKNENKNVEFRNTKWTTNY